MSTFIANKSLFFISYLIHFVFDVLVAAYCLLRTSVVCCLIIFFCLILYAVCRLSYRLTGCFSAVCRMMCNGCIYCLSSAVCCLLIVCRLLAVNYSLLSAVCCLLHVTDVCRLLVDLVFCRSSAVYRLIVVFPAVCLFLVAVLLSAICCHSDDRSPYT